MTAAEAMTSPVVTLSAETPLNDVAHLLVAYQTASLPVMDHRGRLIGLVTDFEVFLALVLQAGIGASPGEQLPRTVAHVMRRTAISVKPEDSLQWCLRVMDDYDSESVAVLKHGNVIGILSRAEATKAIAYRAGDATSAPLEQAHA